LRYHKKMKINQLRCFVQVVEKGSVRGAAEGLGVSATAVSQSLRELERAVSAPLFTRHAQSLTLTLFGRRLLVHARLIIGQIARAEEDLGQLQGLAGGAIAIGVTPWVSQTLLPAAIRQFRVIRPDARIDVSESLGAVHSALRDGSFDLVIGMAPTRQMEPNLTSRPLFSCGLAVAARAGHPLAGAKSLRELAGQSWVMTLRQDGSEQPLNDMLAPLGVVPPPEKIHFARSTLSSLAMLEGSDLLTVCPWPLIESSLMRGRVEPLAIRDVIPPLTTSLVLRRADTLTAAAQIFLDCFLETADTSLGSAEPALKNALAAVEAIGQ
jgi:LysR family transcriptional regulator of abg operon